MNSLGADIEVKTLGRRSADIITSEYNFLTKLKSEINDFKPHSLINFISLSNVDYCETHREECFEVNHELARKIAQCAYETDTHLIHFSTNGLYCGKAPPYSERDNAKPVNYYGSVKLAIDRYILENVKNSLILRPNTVFGAPVNNAKNNQFSLFFDLMSDRCVISAVDDVLTNLLFVEDLCNVISLTARARRTGLYNIAGANVLSRYEFACLIKKIFDLDCDIEPVKSSQFTTPALRPQNTSFNIQKAKLELNFEPTPVDEALNIIKKEVI